MFLIKRPFILLLLLFSCCSSPSVQPERLKISFHTMPMTADPRKSGDFISATLICLIFEGLTRCEPNGSVSMALAESVEISADRLRYLFRLRPSFWSDGAPVTAGDFERSWKEQLNPESGSLSAYLFYPIRNAEKAYKGEASLDEIGIHALNDLEIEVILEEPTHYFLSLTAFPSYLPTPTHALSQFSSWTTPFISNGPFHIDSIESQSHLLLKKNNLYWKQNQIRLDEIQIAIVNNPTTALRMFSRGELDCMGGSISPFPSDALKTFSSVQFFPMNATTFTAFKNDHPYLKNRHLRHALALAINRSEIVEKITQLGETAATRFIPPSLLSNQNRQLFPAFDPISAKEHLKLALEELHLSIQEIPLTLSYSASELNTRIAQALQTEWKEILGLNIALDAKEPQSFKDLLYRREFDIALAFWIAQFLDPINILERFADPKNWKNYPGWKNESFRQKMRLLGNDGDRLRRIEEVEEILAYDMPLAPIYHWSNPILSHPHIHNLQVTPNGAILFENISTKNL